MMMKRKRVSLMPAIAALSQARIYAAGPQHFASVTVHPGDNLWTIADHYTQGGASVQDTVDRILAANGKSDATVVPGEHLKVPR
jgi:predicted Zn-dependent protease